MSHDDISGTFLSGGLKPEKTPIDLPDPDKVTEGTLYRDEREWIWRADSTPSDRGLIYEWVRVTAVSAKQQRRDGLVALVFGVAAVVGTFLAFNLANRFGLDLIWGTLLVVGTFMAFATLCWTTVKRVSHQVVLPSETSLETPDGRSSLETPGREDR